MIDMILAIDKNRGLGLDNKLLYRNKDDMKFFKETSMKYDYIVCGRKTYESVGNLKDRKMIVLTHDREYKASEGVLAMNVEDFITFSRDKHILCIGGAEIYNLLIHAANKVFLTVIDDIREADAFVSEEFMEQLNTIGYTEIIREVEADEDNEVSFTIFECTLAE